MVRVGVIEDLDEEMDNVLENLKSIHDRLMTEWEVNPVRLIGIPIKFQVLGLALTLVASVIGLII